MTKQTQTKQLKEVADIQSGFAFKSQDFSDNGIPIVRISNINDAEDVVILEKDQPYYPLKIDEKISKFLLKKEDILIALSGATTGKIGIYKLNKSALLNQRIALIRSKDNKSNKYLYYFLQTKSQQILKESYGGAQPNISPKNLESYQIYFPDYEIRQLIVSAIETQFSRLDEAVKSLKAVKEKLGIYRKAVLKKAFENEKWNKDKIGNLCILNPSKEELKEIDEDLKVSFIPMAYVSEKGKIISMDKRPLKEVKKGFAFFRNNDILLAKITPCFENGKKAIAENLLNGIGFGTTEFHVLRPKEEVISKWIFYNISREDFRAIAKRSMTGAVGQQRVPKSIIENFKIPIPSLQEQSLIVQAIESKFSVIDKVAQVVEASLEKAEKLRKSILKSAFEGKLVKEMENG